MLTNLTTEAEAARLARRVSLSPRQQDTETLMLNLKRLSDAKAAADAHQLWDALDEIEVEALYCETPAIRQRYEAVLSAHKGQLESLTTSRGAPAQTEIFEITTVTGAGERITFNLDDFGGDFRALERAFRAKLEDGNLD
jgi:hypothetical protein